MMFPEQIISCSSAKMHEEYVQGRFRQRIRSFSEDAQPNSARKLIKMCDSSLKAV